MNKKDEEKIVGIAESEVRKFVKEWKKNPYLWDSEADVHGELYVRIKQAIKKAGFRSVNWQYKTYMCRKERFDWVYCKPLTYIQGGGRYYPDIVIYAGLKRDEDKKINDPMLWVCEIKYKTQWGGDQNEKNWKYDKEKLIQLLQQSQSSRINGTKYAYEIKLQRTEEKVISYCGRVKL